MGSGESSLSFDQILPKNTIGFGAGLGMPEDRTGHVTKAIVGLSDKFVAGVMLTRPLWCLHFTYYTG